MARRRNCLSGCRFTIVHSEALCVLVVSIYAVLDVLVMEACSAFTLVSVRPVTLTPFFVLGLPHVTSENLIHHLEASVAIDIHGCGRTHFGLVSLLGVHSL